MSFEKPSNLSSHEKNMVQMFQHHVDRNGGNAFILNMDKREGELTIKEWAQWRLWRIKNDLGVAFMDHMRRAEGRFQVPSRWPDEFDTSWHRTPAGAHLELVNERTAAAQISKPGFKAPQLKKV